MMNKSRAVGAAVILIVLVSCVTFYLAATALQYVNPVAVFAAVIVAVVGMAWFKKVT